MASITRFRGNSKHTTHTDLAVECDAARASAPGTLIINEGTLVARKASSQSFHVPGIWSDEQVVALTKVSVLLRLLPSTCSSYTSDTQLIDAVHGKGSSMYLQLWALGRVAAIEKLKKEGPSFNYVSSGDVPLQ